MKVALLALLVAWSGAAHAQPVRRGPVRQPPRPPPTPLAATLDDSFSLRGRFGVERVHQLLASGKPDEYLRGVERAATLGAPDGVALLVQQLDAAGTARLDARALVAVARGLAPHVEESSARSALVVLAGLAPPRTPGRERGDEDPDYGARLEMARRMAALALVESGDARAVEAVVSLGRGSGTGSAGAVAALVAFPPSGASPTWPKPMTPGALGLVRRTGDRRALDGVLTAAKAGDAETRAAALDALGAIGDARGIDVAVASLGDEDVRVRVASARALVQLGAPEAARAVEMLVAEDGTAARGIELAMGTHAPGIVRALSARAAVVTDMGVRAAAVAAIGRDPSAESVEALTALARDPMLRANAAEALARSPSRAATGAIERFGAAPDTRRLAAHAYVVRVLTRGETSAALERLVRQLAGAKDGRDRAAGAFARVALGESDVGPWLEDPDPQVRRVAAVASLASPTSARDATLLARLARETDGPTRAVLAAGLAGGDPTGLVPTRALLACAHAGGADAPVCALAFARRASPAEGDDVATLLASRDPLLRAHAARGLAQSDDPARSGRLAAAYAYEPDASVRRALLRSLAAVPRDAPRFAEMLALAARLDPDPEARWTAGRVLAGSPLTEQPGAEVAWVRLVTASGSPPPPGTTAALVRADGLAVPIAFDADGDALVPGTPAGGARLVLAPRLDAAYAPSP